MPQPEIWREDDPALWKGTLGVMGAENRQDKRHLCFPGQHWTPVTQETHTEGPGKWFFREMKG